jgi:hypothetical protein
MHTLEMRLIERSIGQAFNQLTKCWDDPSPTRHQEHPTNVKEHTAHLASVTTQRPIG